MLDFVGCLDELAPRDADDAPSRGLEAAVAGAVVFEGGERVVRGAAVQLDDEACVRPGAIDLHPLDEDVRQRQREARVEEEVLEELLELAADDSQAAAHFFKDSPEGRDSGFAGVPLDQPCDSERIGEPELLGLPERAAQLVALNDRTEVEQSAGDGGDGDVVVGRRLVGGEVGVVERDPRARLSPARDGHFRSAAAADAPMRSGTAVT